MELCFGHGLALAQVFVVTALLFLAMLVGELHPTLDRGTTYRQSPGHLLVGVGYLPTYQREAFLLVQASEVMDLLFRDLLFNPFDFSFLLLLCLHSHRHLLTS